MSLPAEFLKKTNRLELHANGASYSEVGHLRLIKKNVPISSTSQLVPLVDYFCDTLNHHLTITGNSKIKPLEESGVRTRTFFFLKTKKGNTETRKLEMDVPGRVSNLVIPKLFSNLDYATLSIDLNPDNFQISFKNGKFTLEISSEDFRVSGVPRMQDYCTPDHPLKLLEGWGDEGSLFMPRNGEPGSNVIANTLIMAPSILSFGCVECCMEFDFHMGYSHYLEINAQQSRRPVFTLGKNINGPESSTRAP